MSSGSTVYGPCPGCDAWQVDIGADVPVGAILVGPVASPVEGIHQAAAFVVGARVRMLDDAIREHALECPGLQGIIEDSMRDRPISGPRGIDLVRRASVEV